MHKLDCIFCKIVSGELPCHRIWEDEKHLAFLSIFPNTPGFTVVTTKVHYGSYAFEQPDEVLSGLVLATKNVAKVLTAYFTDTARCGMFFEGYGVDHLHSKLSPMHCAGNFGQASSMEHARPDVFFSSYPGYLSSHDYKRADDAQLSSLAQAIRDSQTAK